jgi:hypothetical protein
MTVGEGLGVGAAGDATASALAVALAVGDGRSVAGAPKKVAEARPATISAVARAAVARARTERVWTRVNLDTLYDRDGERTPRRVRAPIGDGGLPGVA